MMGCLWVILKTYHYITNSPLFALKKIEIHGNKMLSKKEIQRILGLKKGINIIKINITELNYKLALNPWVKKSLIKRKLPHTIEIDITEKEPYFLLVENGKIYYVDKRGQKITLLKKYISLPFLYVTHSIDAANDLKLEQVANLLQGNAFPFSLKDIGAIMVNDFSIQFYIDRLKLLIVMDRLNLSQEAEDLSLFIKKLKTNLQTLKDKKILIVPGRMWLSGREQS
ncbi:MAG: FtsQ-type POTRA domain-containing protein [Desulfonauticus sp.]|nr:FtsQ-type POTRA domain-containing protein [Desulfonauticus sp.]